MSIEAVQPEQPEAVQPEARPRPPRRLLRNILLACAGLLATVVLLVWFALSHIANPAIKGRIVRAAAGAGVTLDFDEASASFTELHIAGLRVAQPVPDTAGPPLVAIDHIDAKYSIWRALRGGIPKIKALAIQGVHATLFTDDDGTSSITRLLKALPPSPAKPAGPVKPLSEMLARLADQPVVVESFRLRDVDATLIRRTSGHESERTRFSGLELSLSLGEGKLETTIATPPAGASLERDRGDARQHLGADARVHFAFDGHTNPAPRGEVSMELKLRDQDMVPLPPHAPPIDQVLSVKASFVPDPHLRKTTVKVDGLRLLDGVGTGTVDADLIDDGAGGVKPFIREASMDLALDPLRGFVPDTFGDLQVLSGNVKVSASGVDLSHGLEMTSVGSASAEIDLSRLGWRQGADNVALTGLKVSAHGKPVPDGVELDASVPIGSVKANMKDSAIELARAAVKFHAKVSKALHVTGKLSTTFEELHFAGGAELAAQGGEVHVTATDAAQVEGTLGFAGKVNAEVALGHLAEKENGMALNATDLKLHIPLQVKANGSGAAETHVSLASIAVQRGGHTLLAPTPVRVDMEAPRFSYDSASAMHSTADVKAEVSFGAVTTQVHLEKSARDLRYEASIAAKSLGLVRPFVSAPVPWEKVGLDLDSKGTVSHLDAGPSMQLVHDTTIHLDHGAFRGQSFDVAANKLVAKLSSKGTTIRHDASASIRLTGLTIDGRRRPGEEDVKLHVALDRAQPKVDLRFDAAGEACPEGHLALQFAFDRARRRLAYSTEGALSRLDLVSEVLPRRALGQHHVDWKPLSFQVSGQGDVEGAITGFRDLAPMLAVDPINALRGTQAFSAKVSGIKYHDESEHAADLDSIQFSLNADETAERRRALIKLVVPSATLHSGDQEVDLEDLAPTLTVDLGKHGGRAQLQMALGEVTQRFYPYNIGDVSLDAVATVDESGTVRLEDAKLKNSAGGTTLVASGNVESVPLKLPWLTMAASSSGRHGAALNATLSQHLESLPKDGDITGNGLAQVKFTVESGDLHVFHTTTVIEFDNADVNLPSRNIAVTKLSARIPIKHDRLREDGEFKYMGGAKPAVYPRERFFDYQPFLGGDDYLTLDQISIGGLAVGPIAGNLRIDRNLIALDQLEMSAFGGKMTGQLIVEYDPDDQEASDVSFRGNMTGLAPSNARSGDEVDANAALKMNLRKQELEGKIDIVRLGRDDLRALLDVWDPYHANGSANQTRKALALGYPKEVRLLFHDGFSTMTVKMGGLAGAGRLETTQSTGPILEKYVAPYLRRRGAQ